MEETLLHWISQYGYIAIFSLLMFGITGVPIPDEVLRTYSGYLILKGQLAMFPTIVSLDAITCILLVYYLASRKAYKST